MGTPGIFSRGTIFPLPHRIVDEWIVLVINNALIRAFEILRENPPDSFVLADAEENDITRELEDILENHLRRTGEVAGFNRQMFGKVIRANELTNYDGKHPDKKCDLQFDLKREHLSVLSTHDGFFVECKPVDNEHGLLQHYCKKGLIRFINGDYAWPMQEAMMLAYVRNGRTITTTLAPQLAGSWCQTTLGRPTSPIPVIGSLPITYAEALHVTTHQRGFSWTQGRGQACAIRIYHSWHSCS